MTNSLLGVVAALTGGLIGALLQSPLVLIAIAAVLVDFIPPDKFLNRMVSLR